MKQEREETQKLKKKKEALQSELNITHDTEIVRVSF